MVERKVLDIDHDLCDGCGDCIPACPEGAIQLIDGKARLVNEAFCDGLGACIGECPKNAIEITKKEAEPYDEKKVVENMADQGKEVLKAHLEHLKEHNQEELLETAINHLKEIDIEPPEIHQKDTQDVEKMESGFSGCPGTKTKVGKKGKDVSVEEGGLGQWPVQLSLVPVEAPYFKNRGLVFLADCVPVASSVFHNELMDEGPVVLGCPKLDDTDPYIDKLTSILSANPIERLVSVHMEVPCCYGLNQIIEEAVSEVDRDIEIKEITIGIDGEKIED